MRGFFTFISSTIATSPKSATWLHYSPYFAISCGARNIGRI